MSPLNSKFESMSTHQKILETQSQITQQVIHLSRLHGIILGQPETDPKG